MVLALPLPVIWGLKVNLRRKVGIVCIFLLGVFVCVASIIRIIELTKFVVTDPTYTQVHASTWTTLEQGVAVISGNLPLLAPLFERYFRQRGYGSGSGSGSGYASGYGKGSKGVKLESGSRGGSQLDRSGKFGGGNPRLNFNNDMGTTTVTAKRLDAHDQYRLSDEESQTQADSAHEIELDDRAILVKTQVSVTQTTATDVREKNNGSSTDGRQGVPRKSSSWLKA